MSLRSHQTSALLIRSWHWQRRQYCNGFCTFIFPSLIFILISVLNRVLTDTSFDFEPYEQTPRGAFAPRPFDPEACLIPDDLDLDITEEPNFDFESAVKNCVAGSTFRPNYVVPVYTNPSISDSVGSHDARNPANNTGMLGSFSLDPFAYRPAVDDSYEFYDAQTRYDGPLRYENFFGLVNNSLYQNITRVIKSNSVDFAYAARTLPLRTKESLFSLIYDQWYTGNIFDRFFSAFSIDALNIPSSSTDDVTASLTVYYNESQDVRDKSCTILCPLVSSISRLYSALYAQIVPGKSVTTFLRRMPLVNTFGGVSFINLIISILIVLTTHFLFPNFVSILVYERTSRMRDYMSSMGLPRWLYWVGTYISLYLTYVATIIVLYIVGRAIGIGFFTFNNPLSIIILFLLWGNALISFAMFLEPFFNDPQTAQIVGWLLVVIINFIGGPFIGQRIGDERTTNGTWAAIMLLPSFAYMRSVYYAGAINSADEGVSFTAKVVRGNQLGMCSGSGPFCWSYGYLVLDSVILLVLAAYVRYLSSALQDGNRHPLFFLGMRKRFDVDAYNGDDDENDEAIEDSKANIDGAASGIGGDVKEEQRKARQIVSNMSTEPFDGAVLHRISKTYPGRPIVQAVRSISLIARRGEVLTILGHNGAGKTTLFKCLVGETKPTSGESYVSGYSVASQIDQVHQYMGLAAQQDILWPDMSVQEHLFFFGRVKGLRRQALKEAVETALTNVQLSAARKRRTKALSGGMRRRLSVSIAMMGDSQFVVLDEPSTGLDLLSRERLWHAIENMRTNKAVILTTHSLEEAETLSNRVAIMSSGELKCIGTAEQLKLRLGDGHRLTVSLPTNNIGALLDCVSAVAPGTKMDTVVGNNAELVLPKDAVIPRVLYVIAENKLKLQIRDWAIQQASLEDVFLKVMRFNRPQGEDTEEGMASP